MAALTGLRILDFSQMMAGPFGTMLLGDLGADVVKVEPPQGDPMRRTGDTKIRGSMESDFFVSVNRNKRGIVLDLKTDSGVRRAQALAGAADVVVENFRPGVADRIGIGYDALKDVNPRLIYCSITGFGQEGALRDKPALDPVIQALSGLMQLTGEMNSTPLRVGFPFTDYITPVFAVVGILAALQERSRSGVGQRIDLSMLDSAIFGMIPRESYFFATGKSPARSGNAHFQIVPCNTYSTADNREIMVIAHNEKYWASLVSALEEPALSDPRFQTNGQRLRHRTEVDACIAAAFRKVPLEDWLTRLSGKEALFAPIKTLHEVFSDPSLGGGLLRDVPHPTAGILKQIANPLRFSRTPIDAIRPPPLLGEHTTKVLSTEVADDEHPWPAS